MGRSVVAEFTFKLDCAVADQLANLAMQLKLSPADALSKALSNTAFLTTVAQAGSQVLLRHPDKKVEVVNLGLESDSR